MSGAHIIPFATLRAIPEDAIVHPLARLGGYIKPAYLCASSRFTIGDYDRADMEFVRATNPEKEFRLGPVGCPPALERDGKPETRDIDVLIHGIAGLARLAAVYDLSRAGLVTAVVSGPQDAPLARAKLVLNASLYKLVVETVRVFHLLFDPEAVVSVVDPYVRASRPLGGRPLQRLVEARRRSRGVVVGRQFSRRARQSRYSPIKNRDIRGKLSDASAA